MMTEAEKDWYIDHGMPEKKLVAIPSGVDDDAFRKVTSDEILKKYDIYKGNFLLYLGRLHEEKSINHLIDAFECVYSDYPDLKLVLAGPDAGAARQLMKFARTKGVWDRVILTGKVDDDEKIVLLGNCAMFVLPSQFEAEGVVLLEAMAQGKPVIASKVGGVPYIIKDGKTGMLYNYGDVDTLAKLIIDLLENPRKGSNLGLAGFAYVQRNFRWETIIDQMEKLYQDVKKQ
jgi:glycosyltransferase involved in cell wall biosynthesis